MFVLLWLMLPIAPFVILGVYGAWHPPYGRHSHVSHETPVVRARNVELVVVPDPEESVFVAPVREAA